MIKNILKAFPWALAFLVFAACTPFVAVGYWMMSFMRWLYKKEDR